MIARFALVATWCLLAGCGGGAVGDAPPDAGALDAGRTDAGRADGGSRTPSPVPVLGEACMDGWCFEAPRPLGPVTALHAEGAELWGVVPLGDRQRLFHFDGTSFDFPDVTLGPPSSFPPRFAATAPDDVWLATPRDGASELFHFDGTSWSPIPTPFDFDYFDRTQRGRAVAMGYSGDLHAWDGARWIDVTLPDAVRSTASQYVFGESLAGTLDGVAYFGVGIVVASAPRRDELWQWDGTTVERAPFQRGALYATTVDDVWAGASHWDGTSWDEHPEVSAIVVGGAPNDVWAIGSTTTGAGAYEWDGVGWALLGTFPQGLRSLAPASPNAWAADTAGGLHYFDGVEWHALTVPAPSSVVDLAATSDASGPRAWGVVDDGDTSVVIARAADGTWAPIEETRGAARALRQLRARATDDVWAFGSDVMHTDGGAWVHRPTGVTTGSPDVSDLCAADASHAYASMEVSLGLPTRLLEWDGAWHSIGRIDPGASVGEVGGSVRCLASGAVWSFGGPVIAQRTLGDWASTPPFESLYTSSFFAASPTSIDATSARGLVHWDGREWSLDALEMLGPRDDELIVVEAIGGSSETDVTFIVARQTGSAPAGPPRTLLHRGASGIDRTSSLALANAPVSITALGVDDVLVLDTRGGVWRVTGGASSLVATPGFADVARGMLVSTTDGWAITSRGVARFDGAAWGPVADVPAALGRATDVVAFGTDAWLVGNAEVAHFDGTTWTEEPLVAPGSPRIGGTSNADLRVWTGTTVWLRRGGVWSEVPLVAPADRIYGVDAVVGPFDDLWIAGAHAPHGSILPWYYHYDGTTLTPYPAPTNVADLREVGGELYAAAYGVSYSGVVQRTSGAWTPRPDLDPAVLFSDDGPLPFTGASASAAGTRWAATGSVILRHDP